tara:strand:+ start:1148 stop:1777 length:630 start_codon:yes stop_codon:yes gene_type:complete
MVTPKTKNQIDRNKIRRLKIILPLFIFVFIILMVFQYISSKKVFTLNEDARDNYTRLTIESTSGVIKPLLTGNTSDGGYFRITANRASPLGPELRDIELEKVKLEFFDDKNLSLKLTSNFAKYLASSNSATLYENLVGKTFEGFSFSAVSANMNLDTNFTFFEGPIIGSNQGVTFEAGQMEIQEKGDKIFFSSGVKVKILSGLLEENKN